MKLLVAGVGNIFFGDDGFGPAVANALAGDADESLRIVDYGIAGIHLAHELVAGYDRVLLIDAVPRGEVPGTLYLIEPGDDAPAGPPDPHGMDIGNAFAYARILGGDVPPVTILGCEPADVDERIGLSPEIEQAVEAACAVARRLIGDWQREHAGIDPRQKETA